jgi:ribosomal protein S18 acetylase RimI-like enzyme
MSSTPDAGSARPAAAVMISEVTEVTRELVDAFAHLIPQLSSSSPPPGESELKAIVTSRASVLLVARDPERDNKIVGSLTLVLFRIPTGVRAWIEDVVVDGDARRRGVADALNRHAIDHARRAGARTVDLTSRPEREAANLLYRKIGFQPRDTNVYRYTIER